MMWLEKKSFSIKLSFICLLLVALSAQAKSPTAAIASAHPLATRAGHEILDAGGNVFDAAVAVTAALAVVEPSGSGLGGGGFWLLHRAKDNFEIMIDGRERAPGQASRDMYLDKHGQPIPGASLNGPLAAAIPGEPAALAHIAEHYGRLPLSKSLAPAIRYAEQGFEVTAHYRRLAKSRYSVLKRFSSTSSILLNQGKLPDIGNIIIQKDLARTLKKLAAKGRAGFYQGEVARQLVNGVKKSGGIWTLDDLKNYPVVERQPVKGRYHNMEIATAALPSSGGVVLIEALNILGNFKLNAMPDYQRSHTIIEAMRLAYRDRARYLGDPDFVKINTKKLLSRRYARSLKKLIDPEWALPSSALKGINERGESTKGSDTSHFSIIDNQGNRVAATLSINYPFGSGFIPPGTGVVLNNEMDDFSIKPGIANVYGLVGNEANAIAPGKRPLSSMSPTFLETPDATVVLGTPGGSRIITMVLLAALEIADGRGEPENWVALPRFHHQYLPDKVFHESRAFSDNDKRQLEGKGHVLQRRSRYGNMQIVMWNKKDKKFAAASDPRGEGLAKID